jgi:hypothetical protein
MMLSSYLSYIFGKSVVSSSYGSRFRRILVMTIIPNRPLDLFIITKIRLAPKSMTTR